MGLIAKLKKNYWRRKGLRRCICCGQLKRLQSFCLSPRYEDYCIECKEFKDRRDATHKSEGVNLRSALLN